jgi:hypothetical protein
VADIVRDCTDTAEGRTGAAKEPWLLRKTRCVASLEHKPIASLLEKAADKAHRGGSPSARGGCPAPQLTTS